MYAWRYARVAMVPTAGATIAASVQAWSVAGSAIPQAGLSQEDSIQAATDLAILRHTALFGDVGHFAFYDARGAFMGDAWGRGSEMTMPEGASSAVAIVGDEPIRTNMPDANGELGPGWNAELALAIDRVLKGLKGASQGASIPEGFGTIGLPVLAPALVAIIVGGAAVGIIGSVAAWRYLDPQLRAQLAAVRAAASAYQLRVETWKATGTMPGPSPIELANADAVRATGAQGSSDAWIIAGAAVGGLVLGGLGLSALQNYVTKAA